MRNITKIIGIGMLSLASLVGCGEKSSPKSSVLEYLESLYKEKYDIVSYRQISKDIAEEDDSLIVKQIKDIDLLCEMIENRMTDDNRENFYKSLKEFYGKYYNKIARTEMLKKSESDGRSKAK